MSRSSKALHLVVPVKLVAPFTLIARGLRLWDGGLQMDAPAPPNYILPNNCSWPCNIASEKVGDAYFIGSENGWVDQDIFLEWLTTVVVKETGCSPSDPLLLFTDGHSFRYTLPTIAKARAKGIFKNVIPPHATHFMCVTDKTCHSPYQKRYAALKRVHESTYSSTTWANYVGISSRAYVESFTPSNLING